MFKYKNTSKFYKMLTIDGKRTNIPPNGIFSSSVEIDINIHDFLEKASNDAKDTFVVDDKPKNKKIEVIDQKKYEKLENALLILDEKIQSKKEIESLITESLKEVKISDGKDLDSNINDRFEKIENRLEILKKVSDEIISAVNNLEVYVFENSDNIPIVVVDDEEDQSGKNQNRSIEDILKGG